MCEKIICDYISRDSMNFGQFFFILIALSKDTFIGIATPRIR